MAEHEHRALGRDSLFLLAELRTVGGETARRVKVRNLSARGMMAEGAGEVLSGAAVEVNIRNIGWVTGSIAWVAGDRCGIAFCETIDPLAARDPVKPGESTPRYVKPPLATGKPNERLRKI